MTERPIIFNGEMVRAILDGRKTQTRRPVKNTGMYAVDERWHGLKVKDELIRMATQCPYGQPGDRLWVRETFALGYNPPFVYYRSDFYLLSKYFDHRPTNQKGSCVPYRVKWQPSIHMPRNKSRITLEITNVRVERVQEITPIDVLSEVAPREIKCGFTFDYFKKLWDSIYAAKGLGWSNNPWVWVVEFKRV